MYYSDVFLDSLTHPHQFSATTLSLIVAGLLLILAFEVWMLVDVLTKRSIPATHRLWWVLLMFLIHPLVAIVYYFVRPSYNKKSR